MTRFQPVPFCWFVALILAALAALPAQAQQPREGAAAVGGATLEGTVVNDGEPVAGVEVVLHRVMSEQSGTFDQRTTGEDGGFTFRLPPADTAGFAVYFTTVEFEGARYFGRAIHRNEVLGEYTVEVFDSTSTAPLPIRQSRRDMVLVSQPDGGWQVDEVVRIHNPNALTLVSSSGAHTWEFRIPEGAESFEVGPGEIPGEQVSRMDSRVLLLAPLLPGTRELFFRYRIPPSQRDAVVAFDSPADTFNLFIRQPSPTVSVTGLRSTDMITVENDQFLHYSATDLPVDSDVGIEWESAAPPVDPVVAAVAVTLLLLAAASVAAVLSARRPPAARGPGERDMAVGRAES